MLPGQAVEVYYNPWSCRKHPLTGTQVQKALKGLVVLSAELEAMGNRYVSLEFPATPRGCVITKNAFGEERRERGALRETQGRTREHELEQSTRRHPRCGPIQNLTKLILHRLQNLRKLVEDNGSPLPHRRCLRLRTAILRLIFRSVCSISVFFCQRQHPCKLFRLAAEQNLFVFDPFAPLPRLWARSMFDQAVPAVWQSKGYPSLKPLGPWYQDLLDRLGFMSSWVDHGIPPVRARKGLGPRTPALQRQP